MKTVIKYFAVLLFGIALGTTFKPTQTRLIVERCELDHSKDYIVACLLSDICRCALDHEYLDYPGFEDLFWDVLVNQEEVDPEAFKDYVYAY